VSGGTHMARKEPRGQEEGHGGNERWLITYSDMITLLMVFFIVMYSMANTDLKKFAQVAESMQIAFHVFGVGASKGGLLDRKGDKGAGESPFGNLSPRQRDFVSVSADMSAFAAQAGIEGQISVNMNIEGIIISLSEDLAFEPGSADLRPEATQVLHEIAKVLQTTDNRVRIEGHTDNVPTNSPMYPTNWELSSTRAVAIVRYLVEHEGIAAQRMSAAGYAEFKPVAENDSRSNRALNRRADMVIIYPESSRQFTLDKPNGAENGQGAEAESGDTN
jgi:chemotaxis protein MotB